MGARGPKGLRLTEPKGWLHFPGRKWGPGEFMEGRQPPGVWSKALLVEALRCWPGQRKQGVLEGEGSGSKSQR